MMSKKFEYKICSKTIMDTIGDPDISFDGDDVCNYYYDFMKRLKVRVPQKTEAKHKLDRLIRKIKKHGKGKQYDCIIGVSGGVDSTYTAWLVKQFGLRPLAVHLDNGWNSELAVKNIENILNKLNIDLYTKVLDWEMFKDLQLSFLKASTPDGEIPTDHAIYSILYKMANKFNIKYIIIGMNFRHEGMLPRTWARGHMDWKYIRSVQNIYGAKSIRKFPHLTFFNIFYLNIVKRIRFISFINYIEFDRNKIMALLKKELGWKNYGGKHYESIYTRFYQSYILPKKFNIDKRKAHLSCLIASTGQVTRDQALEIVKDPPAGQKLLEDDKQYVIKKLDLTEAEFDNVMDLPLKSIHDYPNNHFLETGVRTLLHKLRYLKILPN